MNPEHCSECEAAWERGHKAGRAFQVAHDGWKQLAEDNGAEAMRRATEVNALRQEINRLRAELRERRTEVARTHAPWGQ